MAAPVWNLQKDRAAALIRNLQSDPNLVALWPMHEQSGQIHDWGTGNRLNSTAILSTPTYSNAIGDFWGLGFDTTEKLVNIGNVSALNFERTSPWSGLVITNPANMGAAARFLLGKFYADGWFLQVDGSDSNKLRFGLEHQTGAWTKLHRTSTAGLTIGTPTMVGWTYDGSSTGAGAILYKDGAVLASTATADNLAATVQNTNPFVIGAYSQTGAAANSPYSGTIGLVVIFNTVKPLKDFYRWAALGGFL